MTTSPVTATLTKENLLEEEDEERELPINGLTVLTTLRKGSHYRKRMFFMPPPAQILAVYSHQPSATWYNSNFLSMALPDGTFQVGH